MSHKIVTPEDVYTPGKHRAETVPEAEEMRVLVATPCYGGLLTEKFFTSAITALHQAKNHGIHLDFYTSAGESLITRARNDIVATFLGSEANYTHLLFIDADISFDWVNVERALNSPHDVTGGVYPLKTVNWDKIVGQVFENKTETIAATISAVINLVGDTDEHGYAEVLDTGTGFLCIKRHVLEQMVAQYDDLRYTKDDVQGDRSEVVALFDTMIYEGRYLSEDYAFCRRWQNLGGTVHVDMASPLLLHQGAFTYGKVS